MNKGYIFDLKRYCVNDGPGIRTTVFLKGCPLNCIWCHNPESQSPKPERTAVSYRWNIYSQSCSPDVIGKEVSAYEIMEEIRKDIPFYTESDGGVTFSGGEPMLQINFLKELLEACSRENIHTIIDTSGYAPTENFDEIYVHTDLFLFDLKICNDEHHKKYTGVSNRLIMENLRHLSGKGKKIVIRIPVIPGINDSHESTEDFMMVLSTLNNIQRVELLPFHNSAEAKYAKINKQYHLSKTHTPSPEIMEQIKYKLSFSGIPIYIAG